eukprot:TRINITY_DN4214_c0_g1_i11.p2 TRINITY_DN4214_c0_g1~~TRINITY_DN4214_c0_g1_i11.p2  ORF type:complete len:152 (+),score=0.40 TRINITY_DN4214_c0_g1_i11:454-909(+)
MNNCKAGQQQHIYRSVIITTKVNLERAQMRGVEVTNYFQRSQTSLIFYNNSQDLLYQQSPKPIIILSLVANTSRNQQQIVSNFVTNTTCLQYFLTWANPKITLTVNLDIFIIITTIYNATLNLMNDRKASQQQQKDRSVIITTKEGAQNLK